MKQSQLKNQEQELPNPTRLNTQIQHICPLFSTTPGLDPLPDSHSHTGAARGQDIRLYRPDSDNAMLYDPDTRLREWDDGIAW